MPDLLVSTTTAGGAPLLRRKALQSQQGELPCSPGWFYYETTARAWEPVLLFFETRAGRAPIARPVG